MSIDVSGQHAPVKPAVIAIHVSAAHPLIKLALVLPWVMLMNIVVEDLKKTTAKGYWWLGRKICVRIHLAAYLLQLLYNRTDRAVEYAIKDNAAYQVFCGLGIVNAWHAPDHTKIEEFRSRLSAETQRTIANTLSQQAVKFGFADPSQVDFDSTVQEANISYPADSNMMTKLAELGKKLLDYLKKHTRGLIPETLEVDMKAIKEIARSYFFMAKNTAIEKKREVFEQLLIKVKKELRPIIDLCAAMDADRLRRMPWNVRRALEQINDGAWRYLLDVGHFTRTQTMKLGKKLSLHAKDVACIIKNKAGKDKEFGRVFQLGRLAGNFLFVAENTSLRMNDKQSFPAMLAEHAVLFGEKTLKSVAADKGYWAASNKNALIKLGIKDIGLQMPSKIKNKKGMPSLEIQEALRDRRAGIEPLIGHVKHGGQLGRSRMKSDAATLAAGYASVAGFNMRQIIRHQGGKYKKAV